MGITPVPIRLDTVVEHQFPQGRSVSGIQDVPGDGFGDILAVIQMGHSPSRIRCPINGRAGHAFVVYHRRNKIFKANLCGRDHIMVRHQAHQFPLIFHTLGSCHGVSGIVTFHTGTTGDIQEGSIQAVLFSPLWNHLGCTFQCRHLADPLLVPEHTVGTFQLPGTGSGTVCQFDNSVRPAAQPMQASLLSGSWN